MRDRLSYLTGERPPEGVPGHQPRARWARRRVFPLIGSAGLMAVGMFSTTWGPTLIGRKEWALPYDLWGTLIATTRLAHGNIGGLYAAPTGLISLPGAAVILLPCAALISVLGLSLAIPGPHNLHPAAWLVAGPYQIALCCITLFAADALAEQLGVQPLETGPAGGCQRQHPVVGLRPVGSPGGRGGRRAAALRDPGAEPGPGRRWPVAGRGGGLRRAAGVLALPVMLAVLPWRRMVPFLVRAALPSAVLLAATASPTGMTPTRR